MHSSSRIVPIPIEKGMLEDRDRWKEGRYTDYCPDSPTGYSWSSEKAKKIIGYKPKYSNRIVEDGVKYFLKEYAPGIAK